MLTWQSKISKDELHVNFVLRAVPVSSKKNKSFLLHFTLYGIFTQNLKTIIICITLKSLLSAFLYIFKLNLRTERMDIMIKCIYQHSLGSPHLEKCACAHPNLVGIYGLFLVKGKGNHRHLKEKKKRKKNLPNCLGIQFEMHTYYS